MLINEILITLILKPKAGIGSITHVNYVKLRM